MHEVSRPRKHQSLVSVAGSDYTSCTIDVRGVESERRGTVTFSLLWKHINQAPRIGADSDMSQHALKT